MTQLLAAGEGGEFGGGEGEGEVDHFVVLCFGVCMCL